MLDSSTWGVVGCVLVVGPALLPFGCLDFQPSSGEGDTAAGGSEVQDSAAQDLGGRDMSAQELDIVIASEVLDADEQPKDAVGEVLETVSDVGPCEYGNDLSCDDGDSCTKDRCLADGNCEYSSQQDVCKIEGVCVAAGTLAAGEPCKVCAPQRSLTAWSARVCDDGEVCTDDVCDAASGCMSFAQADSTDCSTPGLAEGVCDGGVCVPPGCKYSPEGTACGSPAEDGPVGVCIGGVCAGVTQVIAGSAHTCALLPNGDVVCWGYNGWGQLGIGSLQPVGNEPGQMPPAPVELGGAATQLAAGDYHTCALVGGTVRCWGRGSVGRLGSGSDENLMDEPGEQASEVNLGDGSVATAIAAGDLHTCALVAGGVRCWGLGTHGRLGSGGVDSLMDEAGEGASKVDLGDGAVASMIAAGGSHTCALVSGQARCWGLGASGQLGSGTTDSLMDEPNEEASTVALGADGAVATAIAAGFGHTCAVVAGQVRCWGAGSHAQLGSGGTADVLGGEGASSVKLGSGVVATAVAAGTSHTCAVASGKVRCWGSGEFGQLGTEDTATLTNAPNEGPAIVDLGSGALATDVTLGSGHTCAVVSGQVRCWGRSIFAQLGLENTEDIGDEVDEMPPPVVNVMGAPGSLCTSSQQCLSGACVAAACAL